MTPNLPGLHFPKSPGSVEMLRYIVRRLFSAVPVLFGITLLAFLLGILSPGNPAEILLSSGGESAYTAEQLAEVERQLGLDRPYPQQYVRWIGGVLQGDWGDSFRTKEPVREELFSRFGVTIKLAAGALLLTVMVGIPFGVLSAAREGGLMDRLSQWGSILLLSVPSFWAAILSVGIFAEQLHWLPTSGQETWLHLVLPAIVLSFSTVGTTIRLTRSTVIRELSSQYITAARGKGHFPTADTRPPRLIQCDSSGADAFGKLSGRYSGRFGCGGIGVCHQWNWKICPGFNRCPRLSGPSGLCDDHRFYICSHPSADRPVKHLV